MPGRLETKEPLPPACFGGRGSFYALSQGLYGAFVRNASRPQALYMPLAAGAGGACLRLRFPLDVRFEEQVLAVEYGVGEIVYPVAQYQHARGGV